MKFFELEDYRATCIIEQVDLDSCGLSADDIFDRTPEGMELIKSARQMTLQMIKKEWPHCAFSMQISAYQNGDIALVFSENIDDFVYNLKQSSQLMEQGAEPLWNLIREIEARDEKEARELIRQFEKNVSSMK